MKKILGVLLLGLLGAAVFPVRSFAEEQGMEMAMHEKMMGAMHGRMGQKNDLEEMFYHKTRLIMENAAELGLSDEQVQKIKTLELATKKSMIKSKADIELLALDIEDALKKDEIDVNNVNAVIDKKYGLKAQEAKTLVSACAEVKNVLNKDQMKKLRDIWKEKKAGEGKRMMMERKEESNRKTGMR